MARKIIHQLVDDLDGTVLEPGEGESVSFALDGKAYEIDLTDRNAAELRSTLNRYISAGRRAGTAVAATRGTSRRRSGQVDYAPIRAWAKENGYKVSERGRVSAEVLAAYEAAN
ncbi:MAG: Lsr2 family protein [Microbacterium sp.]